MMKAWNPRRARGSLVALLGLGLLVAASSALAQARVPEGPEPSRWEGYLDYAYVYSSADSEQLRARLQQYGKEAGHSLQDYLAEVDAIRRSGEPIDDDMARREAVGRLLQYLVTRNSDDLEKSVDIISGFEGQHGRHENLYWYHYVMAHHALERGSAPDFVHHNLQMWLDVVVPLESAYTTLESLSLSQSANSGFVSALPYVFENTARLVLLRSQEAGMNRGLDPLAVVVRMLHDGRVGAHPDVIPPEASSKDYLERIVSRLDGPESDGGSLTFTLALFDAARYHEQARGLLASQGFSEDTRKAIGVTSGAYDLALDRAQTLQGQAVVQIRVLRLIGEVHAAKQRLGVDPPLEMNFQIEDAIHTYAALFDARENDEWVGMGFRSTGRDAWVSALHLLWEEIQEASLNVADYYIARSQIEEHRRDDLLKSAARIYSRYLSFFAQFATNDAAEFAPDAAYFAAYESARGFADAYMHYGMSNPTPTELDMTVRRYRIALRLFPFDRRLWSGLTTALEWRGQSNEYMAMARPIADAVVRSRHLHEWVAEGKPASEKIAPMRSALADDLALMYLGFADGAGEGELEGSLAELKQRRSQVQAELDGYESRRAKLAGGEAVPDAPASPAALGTSENGKLRLARGELARKIQKAREEIAKLDKQIRSRSRAIPLYRATISADRLIQEMRVQRDHPVHALLRRMYHETRPEGGTR